MLLLLLSIITSKEILETRPHQSFFENRVFPLLEKMSSQLSRRLLFTPPSPCLCVSSLSAPLSLSLPLSLSVCLYLSLSLSLYEHVSERRKEGGLSFSLCQLLSISLSPSLSLSLSASLSLSLFPYIYMYDITGRWEGVSPSHPTSLPPSLYIYVNETGKKEGRGIPRHLSLYLSPYLPLSRCLSLSISMPLPFFLYIYMYG